MGCAPSLVGRTPGRVAITSLVGRAPGRMAIALVGRPHGVGSESSLVGRQPGRIWTSSALCLCRSKPGLGLVQSRHDGWFWRLVGSRLGLVELGRSGFVGGLGRRLAPRLGLEHLVSAERAEDELSQRVGAKSAAP